MKRRILLTLLALVMCLSLLPASALADTTPMPGYGSGYPVRINDIGTEHNQGYCSTLEEAIDAVKNTYPGRTIQLEADVTVTGTAAAGHLTFPSSGTFTIDLKGNTLLVPGGIVSNGATVTFKDTSGGGKVVAGSLNVVGPSAAITGLAAEVKVGTTTTYYPTLKAALAAAQSATSATVTLLEDYNDTTNLALTISGGTMTLDLDGHRITGGSSTTSGDLLIENSSIVTIKDSGANGYIKRLDIKKTATVKVEGGKYGEIDINSNPDGTATTKLLDLLPNGYAFTDKNSNVVSANTNTLNGTNAPFSVVSHTCAYAGATCACGRTYSCAHTNVDETTGKCQNPDCNHQFTASVSVNGGAKSWYDSFETARNSLTTDAEYIITLYQDATAPDQAEINEKAILFLNGKTLTVGESGSGTLKPQKNLTIYSGISSSIGSPINESAKIAGSLAINPANNTKIHAGVTLTHGIYNNSPSTGILLSSLLMSSGGEAFKNDGLLINASTVTIAGSGSYGTNLTVVSHGESDHSYILSGTDYTCDCGAICSHPGYDIDDGRCSAGCGYQWAIKLVLSGNGTCTKWFKGNRDGLRAAFYTEDASGVGYPASRTITLYDNVPTGDVSAAGSGFIDVNNPTTLNLNGYTLELGLATHVDGSTTHDQLRVRGSSSLDVYGGNSSNAIDGQIYVEGGTLRLHSGVNLTMSCTLSGLEHHYCHAIQINASGGSLRLDAGVNLGRGITGGTPIKNFLARGVAYAKANASSTLYAPGDGTSLENSSPSCSNTFKTVTCPHTDESGTTCKYCGTTLLTDSAYDWFTSVYNTITTETSSVTFTISNYKELIAFANLVNGVDLPVSITGSGTGQLGLSSYNFASHTVELANNIDLDNIDWTPIGGRYRGSSDTAGFDGTFDGNGKSITNLSVTGDLNGYAGLFGYVRNNGTIRNLSVSGSVRGDEGSVGGIVGHLQGGTGSYDAKIENCSFSGTVTGGSSNAGGIAGNVENGKVIRCANTAEVSTADGVAGGIVGYMNGSSSIENCYNQGNVSATAGSWVGGIVGGTNGAQSIKHSYNSGALSGTGSTTLGGIVGYVDGTAPTFENCYFQFVAGLNAIGGTTTQPATGVSSAPADDFHSGKIAWQLNQGQTQTVWGQDLSTTGSYPDFSNSRVYQVVFMDGETELATKYVNAGTVTEPDMASVAGFSGWNTAQYGTGTSYASGTVTVNSDLTLYAQTKTVPTVSLGDSYTITYGDEMPTLTGTASVGGTNVSGSFAWAADITSPLPVTGSPHSVNWVFTPTDIDTYATVTGTASITVNKKTLTITGVSATNRDYNATTTVTLTGGTLNGVVGTADVDFNLGTGTMTDVNAGENKPVTTDITLTGTAKDNYTLTQPTGITVTIRKADPSYTVPTGLTATYGQTLADVSLAGHTGWSWMDSTQSVGDASSTPKDFKAVFTPTDTTNYNVMSDIDVSVTVTKASFTFTVTMADYLAGTGSTPSTPQITGNTSGGAVSYQYKLKTAADTEYSSTAPTAAGEYTIKATIAATTNYNEATATANFKVTTAHARVLAVEEGSSVADNRAFATFEQALTHANGFAAQNSAGTPINVTLMLLEDCTVFSDQTITRSMTLDLGSKELTGNGSSALIIASGATVTIDGTGNCTNDVNAVDANLQVKEGGTLTIKNGWFGKCATNNGTLTITGGMIGALDSYGTITIEGGTLMSGKEFQNIGTGTITGGTFNGFVSNSGGAGTLTLKGGTFTGTIRTVKTNGENVQNFLADGYGYRYYIGDTPQGEWYQEAETAFTPGTGKSIRVVTAPLTGASVEPATRSLTVGYAGDALSFRVVGTSHSDYYGVNYSCQWYLGTTEEGLFAEGNKTGTDSSNFAFPAGKTIGTYYVGCTLTRYGYTLRSDIATVTVGKAPRTIDVSITGWTYGDTANAPTVTATPAAAGSDTVTIEYKLKTAADETYSTAVPTAAGEYTVCASIAATDTHTAASDTADFTIAPKAATITALDKSGKVYDPAPDLSSPVVDEDYTIEGLLDGDTVTVTLTCDANMNQQGEYDIVPSAADPNYAFTLVPGKLTLTYQPVNLPGYVIKASAGAGGSITPSGNVAVAPGGEKSFAIAPAAGYVIADVSVDGVSVGAVSAYTFKGVQANHTIVASFRARSGFVDVPQGSYYEDAVNWSVNNGITTGLDATHFGPDQSCTRAQAVTLLWRAAGCPEPKGTAMPFTDIPADSYYYSAVLWAVENGITMGTGNTAFDPDGTCTRAQIVTFIYRALGQPAGGSVNPFADVPADAYYVQAVLWAVDQKITTGTSATAFGPDEICTRAQIVTFIYRAMAD